jgi:hypothetical protein
MSETVDPFERLWELARRFEQNAQADIEHRWQLLPRDLGLREVHEVTSGLLSRQATLAIQLAQAPNSWNGHAAPLYLRAMADVYISLAWILKEPSTRARAFVLYGLGEEKLRLEHRKKELEKAGGDPASDEYVKAMEAWVERQRVLHLVEVNLGSWSGLSTRRMAEEADCLDFYNYVYAPFSSCVHSMWGHIARYDLTECRNPLHQYHRIPAQTKTDLDIHYLYLAGKYLVMAEDAFDSSFNLSVSQPSAFELLNQDLDAFAAEGGVDEDNSSPETPNTGAVTLNSPSSPAG